MTKRKEKDPEKVERWTLDTEIKFLNNIGTGAFSLLHTPRAALLRGYIEGTSQRKEEEKCKS